MASQIAMAVGQLQASGQELTPSAELEKRLQVLLKSMNESYFVVLTGSYNIWQEVQFSNYLFLACSLVTVHTLIL